ncbi:PIN domain-containing protein [Methylobacterium sp. E-066]|uniref:PIN domain-containing protein n=1 Tax=Methylobacterium sp. E-066 TaxID=2836584 RepID=UPI001FB9AAA6|nr:PIN domain-containing protein [Methylobacterium sp. E-066]MCJ2141564.1 PIN domain-containing protein [Methylobacterium sp. E-066]
MFANRFTATIDACVLAGVLRRNLILTLAQWEFSRMRWSDEILGETERAIAGLFAKKRDLNAAEKGSKARASMEKAFEDAMVSGYERYLPMCEGVDPGDAHVIAAALKTQAQVIVTDNLKHFPATLLEPLNLEAKSADAFIADTIALDIGRAVAAIHQMRQRLERPAMTASDLLVMMDANGLTTAVNILQPHEASL